MITKTRQTKAVTEYLERERSINLNILGYLGNFAEAEVYLYNDDLKNGLIVSGVVDGVEQDFFYLCTSSDDFLKDFWESLAPGHKCFSGVHAPVARLFQKGKNVVWQNPCKVFVYKGGLERVEDSGCVCQSLTVEDAEEVDKYYTFRSDDSIHYIRENISRFDSACLRVDGQLAAWCCMHEDNSMGPLFTKEQHRNSKMAWAVTLALMEKLIAKRITPYVQILEDNAVSIGFAEKIKGMEYSHDCVWFGIDKL